MSISRNVIHNISALEKHEFDSVSKIKTQTINGGISPVDDRVTFAKHCLLSDSEGKLNLFPDGLYSYWTNAVDRVGLFRQLLHKNHLIVDLKPLKNNNEFTETYGFSVQQLLKFSTERRVTLNLYAYESNKGIDFQEYTFFQGTRDEENAFERLFRPESNMRINSIRKSLFFEGTLTQSDISYDDLVEEGEDYFDKILSSSIIEELFHKGLIRSTSKLGALHQIARQYAEVKALLSLKNDHEGSFLIQEIQNKHNDPVRVVATLRALRILLSSPFSASLGGHYTQSYSSVNSVELARRYLTGSSVEAFKKYDEESVIDIRGTEERSVRSIVSNYITQTTLSSFKLNDIPQYLDERIFESYLIYLHDNKELISRQAKFIDELSKDIYLSEKNLDLLERHLQSQEELSKSLDVLKKKHSIIWKTFIAVVMYSGTKQLGIDEEWAFVASLGADYLKDRFDEKFSELVKGQKAQVMLDAKEVKAWLSTNQKFR